MVRMTLEKNPSTGRRIELFGPTAEFLVAPDDEDGDYVHVPPNEPHAWRNVSAEPVVSLIFTTPKMGRFFREVGRPVSAAGSPPTAEDLERFAAVSARYGYWNATPEGNAAVGITARF